MISVPRWISLQKFLDEFGIFGFPFRLSSLGSKPKVHYFRFTLTYKAIFSSYCTNANPLRKGNVSSAFGHAFNLPPKMLFPMRIIFIKYCF